MILQIIARRLDRKHTAVLITTISTVVVALYIKRVIKESKKFKTVDTNSIPVPEGGYFYLGHLPLLGNKPSLKITRWHQELGPIFRIKMGVQDWMFVGEAELAHNLFVTKGGSTSGRPYLTYGNGIHAEGGRGVVFADYGKPWQNTRSALLDVISPKAMDELRDLLEKEADRSVDLFLDEAQDKPKGINPLPYARLTSYNVVLAAIFGIPGASSVEDMLFKQVIDNIEENSSYVSLIGDISAYLPILSFLDLIFRKEKRMRDFVENRSRPLYSRLVQLARESNQPNLIKKLDKIKDALSIDEQNVVVISTELMIGGIDTTSTTMGWILALLCNHSKWQKKVADELDLFVESHGKLPSFTERKEVPSLLAVIKEVIRFRPSASLLIPHKVTRDVVINDHVIPKDTIVMSTSIATNNDPRLFSEPEKFLPERYMNDVRSLYTSSNANVRNRELFTFGWGRRMCPGIYMAETIMFNWISRLLWKCTIEPTLSPTGETIYPNTNDYIENGSGFLPVPYNVRLVERTHK